jgi:predicted DNA-binding transcriptional regulator AlpA
MTANDLQRAAELLPTGATITLSREAILEALAGVSAPAPVALAPDVMLTAMQAAERLGVSKRWVYDHADKIGGRSLTARCVRFSSRAIDRYLARKAA